MWPFRKRHPLLVPVAKGKIPSFARSSGYTLGEAAALVAPLVGLDPEVPAAYLILAMPQDGSFRVCAPLVLDLSPQAQEALNCPGCGECWLADPEAECSCRQGVPPGQAGGEVPDA